MKTLWDSSKRVVYNSMKISGEKVHSSIPFNLDLPVDIRDCAVSFDASWHRRGHFSNQGFAAAIDSEFGKVLDYQLYAGSVTIAVNGQRRGRLIILMSLWSIGVSMNRMYRQLFRIITSNGELGSSGDLETLYHKSRSHIWHIYR